MTRAYADAMKVAFNKLFMVPGGSYVYPWESPYLGKDATLFKESTLDVRERYAKYGFEAEMKGHFPEDHIAMMMQFLACLADESYERLPMGMTLACTNCSAPSRRLCWRMWANGSKRSTRNSIAKTNRACSSRWSNRCARLSRATSIS